VSKAVSYHPALDPYHAAFRMLRLIRELELGKTEIDTLRILDFYLVFPALIARMRLPRQLMKSRRTLEQRANHYHFSGDPRIVFHRMEAGQRAALRRLAATGIIQRTGLEEGMVLRTPKELPHTLMELMETRSARDCDLIDCLKLIAGRIPLKGSNGLKARSGLLEYRYDPV
jgi:hypothetical protein